MMDAVEQVSVEERDLKVEEVARFFPHHCTNIGMTLCSCEIGCTPFRAALVL